LFVTQVKWNALFLIVTRHTVQSIESVSTLMADRTDWRGVGLVLNGGRPITNCSNCSSWCHFSWNV